MLVDDNCFRNKKVKLNFLETIIISNTKYDLVVTVLHILNGKYVTHLLATLIDQTNFNKWCFILVNQTKLAHKIMISIFDWIYNFPPKNVQQIRWCWLYNNRLHMLGFKTDSNISGSVLCKPIHCLVSKWDMFCLCFLWFFDDTKASRILCSSRDFYN